jgi:hypothetical protein
MLGEMDMRVHEAGQHEPAAPVDHALRRPRRPDRVRAIHLEDARAVHQHRAVAQDAARAVHGHHDGVLDEDHPTASGRV